MRRFLAASCREGSLIRELDRLHPLLWKTAENDRIRRTAATFKKARRLSIIFLLEWAPDECFFDILKSSTKVSGTPKFLFLVYAITWCELGLV